MSEVIKATDEGTGDEIVSSALTVTNEADTSVESNILNIDEANLSVVEEEMIFEELTDEITSEPITEFQIVNEPEMMLKDTESNTPEFQEIVSEVTTVESSELVTVSNEPQNDSSSESMQSKIRSRELKSLLEAAKESNLDTNIAHKRESRKSEAFSTTTSTVTKRRYSTSSNDSHQSAGKRNMRSQNPDFVQKHRKFLKTVTGQSNEDVESEGVLDNSDTKEENARLKTPQHKSSVPVIKTPKRKRDDGDSTSEERKIRKFIVFDGITLKKEKDKFCWRCHRDAIQIQCETCPRSYHLKCLKQNVSNSEHWPCPECVAIIKAESTKTRSAAMKEMTQENLCELLKFALKRMMQCAGAEPFIHPVDIKSFPDYRTYVIQPMDLTTLQNSIRDNLYGSTVAFTADAKWILHNSIIFNSHQSKLTTAAKSIIKVCKQEMNEIETCTECYLNANTKKNSWFVEVCTKPHILLWAKLRGFPYWPAKGMVTNGGVVDVRFFGAHDRAWVPVKECFLYSKKDPNTTNKHKRSVIVECIKEVDVHIEKLKSRYGEFKHAPYRTLYDPHSELEQLQMLLPKYKPNDKILYKFPHLIKDENGDKKIKKMKLNLSETSEDENISPKKKSAANEMSKVKGKNTSLDISDVSDEIENPLLTPVKEQQLKSKADKSTLKCITISDFDKFMEGYGTEDEEFNTELNNEVRKKFTSEYGTDSEDELNSSMEKDTKNGDDEIEDVDKLSVSSSETSLTNRGMVRTRGGYHNISGKIKVIGRKSHEFEASGTRSLETSPEVSKFQPILTRELEKVNKIGELPENLELSIGSKFKEVMQNAKKIAVKKDVNDINKTESMADKLMKRMSISQSDNENDKVEIVKKQILDNLEATSSSMVDGNLEKRENNSEELKKKSGNETKFAAADSVNNLSSDEESDSEHYLHLTRVKKCSAYVKNAPIRTSTPKPTVNNLIVNNKRDETIKRNSIVISKISGKDPKVLVRKLNKKGISVKQVPKKINDVHTSSDSMSSEDEQTQNSNQKNSPSSFLKIINVKDIMSGKTNSSITINKLEKKEEKLSTELFPDVVEIKSEPISDDEDSEADKDRLKNIETVTNETQRKTIEEQPQESTFKVVDNLTKIIDSVAKNNICNLDTNLKVLVKPQSPKQKARKSFPTTFITNKPLQTIQLKKITFEKKDTSNTQTNISTITNGQQNQISIPLISRTPPPLVSTASATMINKTTNENIIYLNPPQNIQTPIVLPPNQPLSLAQSTNNPILAMVQQGSLNNTSLIIQHPTTSTAMPITQTTQCNTTGSVENVTATESNAINLSEDLSRVIGDIMCNKVPPKLKPKPPGPLSTHFDEGNPSSAGPVTKVINSVSHRLADYFRGLLVETLSDLTNMSSPEAKIRSLELEIENLKHKHTEEMLEFRKNISTILKEIQKSIVEEKSKIVDETRAACEAERVRSVEEAKSKQWCAYCLKEAQFYCCWNTSYCDYPCQQKHWATHMKTCSQSTVRNNPSGTPNTTNKTVVPQTTYKSIPKQYANPNKIVKQTTRMYVKPATVSSATSGAKSTQMFFQRPVQIQTSSLPGQSTLTLVESTPGNFEIVGNHGPISLDGKLIPATSVIGKVKTATVVTSTSAGGTTGQTHKAIILTQKTNQITKPQQLIINKDNSAENKS